MLYLPQRTQEGARGVLPEGGLCRGRWGSHSQAQAATGVTADSGTSPEGARGSRASVHWAGPAGRGWHEHWQPLAPDRHLSTPKPSWGSFATRLEAGTWTRQHCRQHLCILSARGPSSPVGVTPLGGGWLGWPRAQASTGGPSTVEPRCP